MRKRNIIVGIALLEILSIPAAAHLHANFNLPERTHIISAEIPSPAGLKRYFVSSDGPFVVTAKESSGLLHVSVAEKGRIGDVKFGENAQLPGPRNVCVSTSSDHEVIYTSSQGTFISDGEVISQTVLLQILYDTEDEPKLDFKAALKADKIPQAEACR